MEEQVSSLTVNQLMQNYGEWRRFLITLGESFSPSLKRWLEDWRDWEAKISPREDLRGHLRAAHYRGWMDRDSMVHGSLGSLDTPQPAKPKKATRKRAPRKKAGKKDD